MIYTDAQIADLSEPANRLVQANGLYVNQLIVTDIRDAYELAITYRDNRIAELEAALTEIGTLNPLRNDLDAYLSEVASFALGMTENKPERATYGIE